MDRLLHISWYRLSIFKNLYKSQGQMTKNASERIPAQFMVESLYIYRVI